MIALKELEWTISNFGTRKMTILIEFEFPWSISDDVEGKDILVVKVINPIKFFSKESLATINNSTILEAELHI